MTCTAHLNVVRALLKAGTDPNVATRDNGTTPLQLASNEGYVEIVETLLAHGADPNQQTTAAGCLPAGATALHGAAWYGHTGVLRMLLHKGANPLAVTAAGDTALMMAKRHSNFRCVQLLAIYGAKLNSVPFAGKCMVGLLPCNNCNVDPTVQESVNTWMDAVAEWSPLRIAMGCKLYEDALIALKLGWVNPDRPQVSKACLIETVGIDISSLLSTMAGGKAARKDETSRAASSSEAQLKKPIELLVQRDQDAGAAGATGAGAGAGNCNRTGDGDGDSTAGSAAHQPKCSLPRDRTDLGKYHPHKVGWYPPHQQQRQPAKLKLQNGTVLHGSKVGVAAPIQTIVTDAPLDEVQQKALVAKCLNLCQILVQGWAPHRHWLYHSGVRSAVFLMLQLSVRLYNFSQMQLAGQRAAVEDGTMTAAAAALPLLPSEIWLLICGFFQRHDWPVLAAGNTQRDHGGSNDGGSRNA